MQFFINWLNFIGVIAFKIYISAFIFLDLVVKKENLYL